MLHVGTTNPGKLAEVSALLAPLGVRLAVVSLDVPETTDTFDGNAKQKALAYAAHTGGPTLSEDSGLCVAALDGLPGPWSARFADLDLATRTVRESGRSRDEIDPLNNARLLDLLRGVEPARRAAFYKIVVIVARPGEVLFQAEAEYHGWIAEAPRGTSGFGYDPIFVGEDTGGRTLAELDAGSKNQRSHRRRALEQLVRWAAQNVDVFRDP